MNDNVRSCRTALVILFLVFDLHMHSFSQTLSTGFSNPSYTPPSSGYFFDLAANNTMVVDSFDVEFVTILGLPRSFEVWVTKNGGPYTANSLFDPNEWDLLASVVDVVPAGLGSWTPLNLSLDILIVGGESRGFYVVNADAGADLRGFASTSTSNSDLFMNTGVFSPQGRYFANGNTGAPALNVHYSLHGPYVTDVVTKALNAPIPNPLSCSSLSSNQQLSVEFQNLGSAAILVGEVIPVSFQVDGQPSVTEFIFVTNAIPPKATFSHTFGVTADLAGLGEHTIIFSHNFSVDQYAANDVLSVTVNSGGVGRVSNFPWVETFNELHPVSITVSPPGWEQVSTDSVGHGSDWYYFEELSSFSDHTVGAGGGWAQTKDFYSDHASVVFYSPCLDLANLSNPKLRFWLSSFSYGAGVNTLSVDVLDTQTGLLTLDVFGPIGSLSSTAWMRQDVDLGMFAGRSIRLIFRAPTDQGFTSSIHNNHSILIDDVAVYDQVTPVGQDPQIGLATFRIGEPTNPNLELLSAMLGGPYFSTVKPNEVMLMEFSGVPQMPILLLAGVLNPAIANYPAIGTIDIGNSVDPVSGIPTGIVVLADGNLPVGVNPFFNTGPIGESVFGVHIPSLPPGILATLQCLMLTGGANSASIALSNAIQVSIQ